MVPVFKADQVGYHVVVIGKTCVGVLLMKNCCRREFIKSAGKTLGAAMALPYVVPGSALGLSGGVAPSERITLGAIGLGNRGIYDLGHFLREKDVHCPIVCDTFADRRRDGKAVVDQHYGNMDCKATRYHEELLSRDDIDAVLIATGDRWHSVLSMLAARAGKDVYSEKPFSLTIAEGQALVETTERFGTIWQVGTQRRSNNSYRSVVKAVDDGVIGQLRSATLSFSAGRNDIVFAKPEPEPSPDVFDWNRWLGQAPWVPYSPVRVKYWRANWDTGAGIIGDMGPHFIETALWARNTETTDPIEFEGQGQGQFPADGFITVPARGRVHVRYADGFVLYMDNQSKGVRFDGDEGWMFIDDFGNISASSKPILKRCVQGISYEFMAGHIRNFLDSTQSRRLTVSHPRVAQQTHIIVHCANLCLRLGRKLQWDPVTQRFLDDQDANTYLSRTMRAPWRV